MIEVSVDPSHLVAGRRTRLRIRFANSGERACADIVFKAGLPPAITIIDGTSRVEIPLLAPGHVHVHELTVEAKRSGEFQLSSTNFSYRDEFDVPVRVTDFRARLSVEGALSPQQGSMRSAIVPRVARLDVRHGGAQLTLGEWDVLAILVRNTSGIPLNDVTAAISGPFKTDGKRARVPVLQNGATVRFSFNVNAGEGGRHVPVSVHVTYRYPDGLGSVRSQTQDDRLDVVVVSPEATTTQPVFTNADIGRKTILYLAASPQNMEPLRSDLEMRKVKERLQLSRHRDQYRLEPCVAARFDDISQALTDYDPHLVHFSGHGDEHGNLLVEDEAGRSALVTPEGMAELFGQHRATIKCAIVNACHSMRLAIAMARHIDYVIGMRWEIGDEAAIQFSVGFYLALFSGRSVPDAFGRGCTHVRARPATEQEHTTPVLLEGPAIRAAPANSSERQDRI